MGVEGTIVTATPTGISDGKTKSLRERFGDFTPRLLLVMVFLSIAAFNFGYDQGNFSGLQALNCEFYPFHFSSTCDLFEFFIP